MADVKRKLYRHCVDASCSGMRLDQYLPMVEPELSRTLLRKIIDIGGVSHNGRRIRKCCMDVVCGDVFEVTLDGLPLTPYRVTADDILYQDQYLLVLSKPSMVETQPTAARYKGTLYEAVLTLLGTDRGRYAQKKPELGMIQRLDRETSGAILFSTHVRAHRPLTQAFSERRVKKSYLALVAGHPPTAEREIVSNLARTRDANRVKSVPYGGKEAVTRYRVIEQFADTALLEVEILTGRSHQIRVHLSETGCPILGDSFYGGPVSWHEQDVPRTMLHSQSLSLTHPVNGEMLNCTAPIPADMIDLLRKVRELT